MSKRKEFVRQVNKFIKVRPFRIIAVPGNHEIHCLLLTDKPTFGIQDRYSSKTVLDTENNLAQYAS
ncbi:hypothetical protein BWQ96_07345 [Gracilariopsis chorda]|uniref:Calcineurin-like phosphoesterase domain-containing protein n=1 Tax=Gracilariopsis chorda TaxID=448386 RepID=A0A2V3ILH0_9FLOR|nr:hypothetical protein BWQ96_07345 [Gracilariopsis chorda]|eukprot:PXF42898.1 hypothetical protein BWQ96_07345 [Gracilariopsis chorda]